MALPIVIGVSGHRDLRREDIPALRALVHKELLALKTAYPHSPFLLLSALAAGADQLCAEEALALWDGQAGKPDGCGTAEAVRFMLEADYRGTALKALNDGAVLHIATPRQSGTNPPLIASRLIEKKPGSLKETLKRTDEFNAEPPAGETAYPLLPKAYIGEKTKPFHDLYLKADAAALRYQKKSLRTIRVFSVFGALMVLFFLFYDEIEADAFLLLYGAVMALYALLYAFARRGRAHEKYLQYRMLSEALRAQFFLLSGGVTDNIGNAFTWTQKQEITWVREALSALTIGMARLSPIPDDILSAHWMAGQIVYHRGALRRDGRRHLRRKGVASAMLLLSVGLFLGVLLMEMRFPTVMANDLSGGALPSFLLPHDDWAFSLRSLMKILLGAISAGTVFLTSYYDKLSLTRKCLDHETMILLYTEAKARFDAMQTDGASAQADTAGQTDKNARQANHDARQTERSRLLYHLAREEIIENGNWFSYCKENAPTFTL